MARAFETAGHSVFMWNAKGKSTFDIFNEFQPDIFIGQTYNIDRALIKCLSERPHIRVAMKASDYGSISDEIDTNKYPVLIANDKELKNFEKLLDACGKPDLLFIHYHPDYIGQTHNHWISKFRVPVISMMNAADIFDYTGGQYREELDSDVAYVGGYWPYKSKTLDDYILKLCNPNLDLKVRIFGNQGWSVPQYCGNVNTELVKHIFSSSKVCPNVSELHSRDFGYDIVERPFKLAANKCFIVSDYVEGLYKIYNQYMVMTASSKDFVNTVLYFLNKPEDKQQYIDKCYEITMQNHTYFDRAAALMRKLYFDEEADGILKIKAKVFKEKGL